jgi:hypothetical protein
VSERIGRPRGFSYISCLHILVKKTKEKGRGRGRVGVKVEPVVIGYTTSLKTEDCCSRIGMDASFYMFQPSDLGTFRVKQQCSFLFVKEPRPLLIGGSY